MLYSMSTLDKEKWIALVQSFNPTEEVTETQPPSASGGEGTGTQEDIDQDMEELYQAMQDYVQQAGMANQVTLGEGNGYVFISFDDTVFFSGDSYELRDEGKVVLDEVSQIISEVSSSIDEIRVLGHTAQAVPGRVNNVTADRFLASNDTSAGRAENRRVELIVTGLDLDDEAGDNITQYYTMRESTGTSANP